jgi:hypothetical protein
MFPPRVLTAWPYRRLREDPRDKPALTQLVRELRNGGHDIICERVDTSAGMGAALIKSEWDLVTSDHSMAHFSGIDLRLKSKVHEKLLQEPMILDKLARHDTGIERSLFRSLHELQRPQRASTKPSVVS